MNFPRIETLNVANKRVVVRLDLDIKEYDIEDLRIKSATKTLDYLKSKASEIILIAHKGRPNGKIDENLSLKQFQPYFDKWGARLEENLRFNPGEENNDPDFTKKLAQLGDVYINEAFASSHRSHASIVGLPKLMPSALGFHFVEEIENLSKVFNPNRPLVILISGIKKDKVAMIDKLSELGDKVLVGGRLPDFLGDKALESVRLQDDTQKVIVGNLIMDKEDITLNTIDRFVSEIKKAHTILLAGVLGKYEDKGHSQGTEKVFKAIADANAFIFAGGGDTIDAIFKYNLQDGFNWISVGGGAMLLFLINRTLPGIDALQ